VGTVGLWVEAAERRSGLGTRVVYARLRRRFGQWARAGSNWGGLIPLRARVWYCSIEPGPVKTFPISRDFPIDFNALNSKIETLTLPGSTNFQTLHGGR
jgi:hypothetical protein